MISSYFIKNPVFTSVISIIIFLTGLLSINNLPIEQYPQVSPPQIIVSTVYPGASSQTIAQTVVAPLEESLNGVQDMIYMESTTSDDGSASINIYFKVGTNTQEAKVNVNNKVQTVLSTLPSIVQSQGLTVEERSASILKVYALISPDNSRETLFLSNYAKNNIVDELKRIKGVGSVKIFGEKEYAMRVWLNPDKLLNYNLTSAEVIEKIKDQNEQYAAGKFAQEPTASKQMFTYTLQTPDRFENVEQFSNIILKADITGRNVLLKDVATVELGSASYSSKALFNGQNAIPFGIFLQSGANALDAAAAIQLKIDEIEKNFPEGVEYKVPYETLSFIEVSIQEVVNTFIEAMLLVMLIIYIFLQNWRATLIPILAVPISIVGAFAGMYALGYSINLLTLFGLVLAIGIVVDDAIVVIENVEKHMSHGLNPKDATIKAMKEVSGALVAIVLVLCAVFVPVAFLGGLSGVMYKQFAVTIAISVIISGIVALTLTPALCALLLKPNHAEPIFIFRWFNRMFDSLSHGYSKIVRFVIRLSFVFIFIYAGVVYFTYSEFGKMNTELVPTEDQGNLFILSYNPPGSSLTRTEKLADEIYQTISKNPSVEQMIQIPGLDLGTFTNRSNAMITFVDMKDWSERLEPNQQTPFLAKQFTGQLMQTTSEGFSFGVVPSPIPGMSMTGGFDMYVQARNDTDIIKLNKYVTQIVKKANADPKLVGVRSSLNVNTPKYKMEVDYQKAFSKGVTTNDIFTALNAALANKYVNDFTYNGKNYNVVVESLQKYREDPQGLDKVFVRGGSGELLPITSFVSITKTTGTDIITRMNMFQSAKVSGSPAPGVSSSEALDTIERISKEILPKDYSIAWTGTAFQEKTLKSNSSVAFIAGIVFLYLILCALYERWFLPITIIFAVPFAVLGSVEATMWRGLSNDIYFQVGLLVLIGLSAKNAILIVEFALQKRKEGMNIADAAVEAAKLRLRPIIMTSLAFTIGVVPLAISQGAGAASRHSIGTGVIGGMLAATFIAIIFIPMFYYVIEKLTNSEKKQEKKEKLEQKN
ncbi:MAG: multidrug efflux RND transporter permease subunit [Halarcobacter sp.]